MYKSYYGFKEKPFQTTPDPPSLFMGRGHGETYAHLAYALAEDRGFVIVTGEVGSGKTSLVNLLVRNHGAGLTVRVLTPADIAQREPFIETICRRFGVDAPGAGTTGIPLVFRDFLIDQLDAGRRAVLIVDEAQDLTDTAIEEIRMLTNLETRGHYLMQMILVGRPELQRRLRGNRVREFVRRATVSCHLGRLGKDEVGRYIRHRLRHAGRSENLDIFDHGAVESIYSYSRGIPRQANIISDAALVYGYADELRTIGRGVIEAVVKDRGAARENHHGDALPRTAQAGTDDGTVDRTTRRDIEEKVRSLEGMISRIGQELNTRNAARKTRYEAGLELAEVLRRLENRQTILLESIRSLLH